MFLVYFLFLVSIFFWGIILTKFLFKSYATLGFWAFSFLLGSLVSVSFIFVLANIFSFVDSPLALSLAIYLIVSIIFTVIAFCHSDPDESRGRNLPQSKFVEKDPSTLPVGSLGMTTGGETLFFLLLLLFSFYIFFRSFFYDTVNKSILIASNLYLDFGSHIPLIRSFSISENFPTSLPFFGNQPLFYHYLFDFYAGVLEFLGGRLDWALNLISIFSFVSLLLLLYSLSISLFKNKWVGLLSVLFFLFNGTLNFIVFLQKFGTGNIVSNIRNYSVYLEGTSFGPNTVSIFWNLNTFLNQRHFIFGAAIFLLMTYWYVDKNSNKNRISWVVWGVLIGLLPLWHGQVFIAALVFMTLFLVLHKNYKEFFWKLTALIVVSLPQLWLIKSTTAASIVFLPGFLLAENFTLQNFLIYWIFNLGFYIPVIIAILFMIKEVAKKLLLISFSLFLLPNFFQFGPEMFNNHKFFNLWMMFLNIFAGFIVIKIWNKKLLGKIIAMFLIIVLTTSGFLDFFVIKNDVLVKFKDYHRDKFLTWVKNNTEKKALFLTNGDIYDPIHFVGRKTFLGKTHYIFAYGGNPDKRIREQNLIFSTNNAYEVRKLLLNNNISYIVIYTTDQGIETKKNLIDKDFFQNNFTKVYEDNKAVVFKI